MSLRGIATKYVVAAFCVDQPEPRCFQAFRNPAGIVRSMTGNTVMELDQYLVCGPDAPAGHQSIQQRIFGALDIQL